MSSLVVEVESMVADYIKTKYDDETLRTLTGSDLECELNNDEDAAYDFSQRLLYIVLQEINWDKLVAKAKENLPDDEEEDEAPPDDENNNDDD